MAYRALGELVQELQDRLGFGAAGSAGNANQRILKSFLRDAQQQLYDQAHWPALVTVENFTIPAGDDLIAYDTGWNPDRVIWISVNRGTTTSPDWYRLTEGIEPHHYDDTIPGEPWRYARRAAGIEILPERDEDYAAKIQYVAPLSSFKEDSDLATIDDSIVFLMALANAKAHYRHKDADQYASQLTAKLTRVKSTQWGDRRFPAQHYRRPGYGGARPVVVGGYDDVGDFGGDFGVDFS